MDAETKWHQKIIEAIDLCNAALGLLFDQKIHVTYLEGCNTVLRFHRVPGISENLIIIEDNGYVLCEADSERKPIVSFEVGQEKDCAKFVFLKVWENRINEAFRQAYQETQDG